MNKQTLNKLVSAIGALNNIEVKGKTNLMNLGGCISIIEEVCQEIADTLNNHNDKNATSEK